VRNLQLILYEKKSLKVIEWISGISDIVIDGDNISWNSGVFQDLVVPYLILNDNVEKIDNVTQEIIDVDLSEDFIKIDLVKENQELKAKIQTLQNDNVNIMLALTSVYESMNSGTSV
jgi:hypothetical protein